MGRAPRGSRGAALAAGTHRRASVGRRCEPHTPNHSASGDARARPWGAGCVIDGGTLSDRDSSSSRCPVRASRPTSDATRGHRAAAAPASARRSALRLLGHLAGLARLLDDQVLGVPLHDPLEVRILVSRADEEETGLLAHATVGLEVDRDVLGAVGVRALADVDRLGEGGAVLLLEAGDVLVHLAKERLVAGGPLLPEWRHDRAQVSRYREAAIAVPRPRSESDGCSGREAEGSERRRPGGGRSSGKRSHRRAGRAAPLRLARADALRVQRAGLPPADHDLARGLPTDPAQLGQRPDGARPRRRPDGAPRGDAGVRGTPPQPRRERRRAAFRLAVAAPPSTSRGLGAPQPEPQAVPGPSRLYGLV